MKINHAHRSIEIGDLRLTFDFIENLAAMIQRRRPPAIKSLGDALLECNELSARAFKDFKSLGETLDYLQRRC